MIEYFVETAEDYIINDEAEEIEDAMGELITDDYSDIDYIAGDPNDDELEDYEDDDDYEDDEEDFVDYELSDDYY